MADTETIVNGVENLNVTDDKDANSNSNTTIDEYSAKWGFPLEELYKIALKFFKEKEGKALQLTYKDKLKLVAYTKQVVFGKFRNDTSPDVGFLDVVGNDRRQAWQSLGDMSKECAMEEFIKSLNSTCNLFQPYVKALKTEQEEQIRKQKEEEEKRLHEEEERKRQELEDDAKKQQQAERQRQVEQQIQIRAALNQQTEVQFRQYAEQQYPANTQMQDELIRQLQEQHFQQYMQQVYQQQMLQQQQIQQQTTVTTTTTRNQSLQQDHDNQLNNVNHVARLQDGADGDDDLPPLAAASMWTRKEIKELKDSLRNDKDSIIKVGSGETVTVRVPTHEDGSCLFWEFGTDYYDIGFGLYFEWTESPNNNVSVHVSESSDEEDVDEEQAQGEDAKADVESGKKRDDRPPTDEIIPVYRRDCHEEVYCGSHTYPGRGVYLLKFDNSYSLWRSKTLYYRVYYSK
ncbi:hypothetical protein SNE40_010270 [Patella caerulea]|uniref:Golgi resident protein GCP60 n=1 Tax=Patella caerulea TaxID=87958 RepID=A0AAN8JXL3_PATCE